METPRLTMTVRRRARIEQEARTILVKSSPDAENATLGRDAEWYVGLRGEQVDPMDLTIVQQNIDSGRYLSGR